MIHSLFSLPELSPSEKANEWLSKKPKDVCVANIQSLINCTEIHPELTVMHLYWIEVLREVEMKSNSISTI